MRKISISIQTSDLLGLRDEIKKYITAGVDSIHFDIMDYEYAKNFAFGPDIFKVIKKEFEGSIEIDTHFMIMNPMTSIEEFIKLKPDLINIDALSMTLDKLEFTLKKIKASGIKAGLAIQKEDSVERYSHLWSWLDSVVLMSITIGKTGQVLDPIVYDKADTMIRKYGFKNKILAIDGGVRMSTIKEIVNHGFNFIIVGSILRSGNSYKEVVEKLKSF